MSSLQVKKLFSVFCRWKVFQCLDIEAENLGEGALRQVGPFLLEQEEWESFLANHSAVKQMVPESNEVREYILYSFLLEKEECESFLPKHSAVKQMVPGEQ
jgi:hypothetical protein